MDTKKASDDRKDSQEQENDNEQSGDSSLSPTPPVISPLTPPLYACASSPSLSTDGRQVTEYKPIRDEPPVIEINPSVEIRVEDVAVVNDAMTKTTEQGKVVEKCPKRILCGSKTDEIPSRLKSCPKTSTVKSDDLASKNSVKTSSANTKKFEKSAVVERPIMKPSFRIKLSDAAVDDIISNMKKQQLENQCRLKEFQKSKHHRHENPSTSKSSSSPKKTSSKKETATVVSSSTSGKKVAQYLPVAATTNESKRTSNSMLTKSQTIAANLVVGKKSPQKLILQSTSTQAGQKKMCKHQRSELNAQSCSISNGSLEKRGARTSTIQVQSTVGTPKSTLTPKSTPMGKSSSTLSITKNLTTPYENPVVLLPSTKVSIPLDKIGGYPPKPKQKSTVPTKVIKPISLSSTAVTSETKSAADNKAPFEGTSTEAPTAVVSTYQTKDTANISKLEETCTTMTAHTKFTEEVTTTSVATVPAGAKRKSSFPDGSSPKRSTSTATTKIPEPTTEISTFFTKSTTTDAMRSDSNVRRSASTVTTEPSPKPKVIITQNKILNPPIDRSFMRIYRDAMADRDAARLAKEQAAKVAKEQAAKVAEEQAAKVAEEQAAKVAEEQAAKVAEEQAATKLASLAAAEDIKTTNKEIQKRDNTTNTEHINTNDQASTTVGLILTKEAATNTKNKDLLCKMVQANIVKSTEHKLVLTESTETCTIGVNTDFVEICTTSTNTDFIKHRTLGTNTDFVKHCTIETNTDFVGHQSVGTNTNSEMTDEDKNSDVFSNNGGEQVLEEESENEDLAEILRIAEMARIEKKVKKAIVEFKKDEIAKKSAADAEQPSCSFKVPKKTLPTVVTTRFNRVVTKKKVCPCCSETEDDIWKSTSQESIKVVKKPKRKTQRNWNRRKPPVVPEETDSEDANSDDENDNYPGKNDNEANKSPDNEKFEDDILLSEQIEKQPLEETDYGANYNEGTESVSGCSQCSSTSKCSSCSECRKEAEEEARLKQEKETATKVQIKHSD